MSTPNEGRIRVRLIPRLPVVDLGQLLGMRPLPPGSSKAAIGAAVREAIEQKNSEYQERQAAEPAAKAEDENVADASTDASPKVPPDNSSITRAYPEQDTRIRLTTALLGESMDANAVDEGSEPFAGTTSTTKPKGKRRASSSSSSSNRKPKRQREEVAVSKSSHLYDVESKTNGESSLDDILDSLESEATPNDGTSPKDNVASPDIAPPPEDGDAPPNDGDAIPENNGAPSDDDGVPPPHVGDPPQNVGVPPPIVSAYPPNVNAPSNYGFNHDSLLTAFANANVAMAPNNPFLTLTVMNTFFNRQQFASFHARQLLTNNAAAGRLLADNAAVSRSLAVQQQDEERPDIVQIDHVKKHDVVFGGEGSSLKNDKLKLRISARCDEYFSEFLTEDGRPMDNDVIDKVRKNIRRQIIKQVGLRGGFFYEMYSTHQVKRLDKNEHYSTIDNKIREMFDQMNRR